MSREPIDRRRFLAGGLGLAGRRALGGCDDPRDPRRPHGAAGRRGRQQVRPAPAADAADPGARIFRGRHLAHLQAERLHRPRGRGLSRPRRPTIRRLPAQGRRPRRASVRHFAGRASRAAGAHADHPPRLRRGLELHRQMERHGARPAAATRRAEAAGALRRVPLLRHDGQRRPRFRESRTITRASISSTPSTRRPSSPTTSTTNR